MMKRASERFKQKLNVGSSDREWTPTSHGRTGVMEKEIRAFAQEVKAFQKQVKDMSASVEGGLSSFKTVLLAPLPRAHEETAAGIVPIDREVHPIGLNVNPDYLVTANHELQQHLQQEVLVPLDQWLLEYRKTKENNKKLEAIRLELDNKRRVTLHLQEKYQKYKNKKKDTEKTLHKVQGEEDKLKRLAEHYAEKEAEMFNAFLRLIRDSAVLRDFIAAALAILQRCFTTAYTAFAMAPVLAAPMLPPPAQVPRLTYTPADINVAASMRISAAELEGEDVAGPMPLHNHALGMSARVTSDGTGFTDHATPGSPAMTIPEGAPTTFGDAASPARTTAGGDGDAVAHLSPALTPYPKAPASPNADSTAETLDAGATSTPSKAIDGETVEPLAVEPDSSTSAGLPPQHPTTPAGLPPPHVLPKENKEPEEIASEQEAQAAPPARGVLSWFV